MTALRREVSAIAPGVPVLAAGPMDTFVGRSFAASNCRALLLSMLSGLALLLAVLLAVVGIYGILACTAAGRTHEIGVRLALGAEPRRVMWLVLGQGFRLTLTGIAFGLALSLALTRLLANLLLNVSATDPTTLAGVVTLLVLVTLLACYIPARRATRVDPMVALRHE
jgi:putative ABC transport system permease protein